MKRKYFDYSDRYLSVRASETEYLKLGGLNERLQFLFSYDF